MSLIDFIKENGGTVIDLSATVGDCVICDFCGEDYTDSKATGGFLFGSRATCPDCVKRMMPNIIKYGEQSYIKGECPEGMPFKDWVLTLR